jgi:hypothetical protein
MMRCFKMPGTKCVELFKTETAPPVLETTPVQNYVGRGRHFPFYISQGSRATRVKQLGFIVD